MGKLADPEATSGRVVLVVDDEDDWRFLLRTVLEGADCIVIEAEHGGKALALIHQSRPDLVITDVMMPVMGGPELLRRLRGDPEYQDILVMVVSAQPNGVTNANALLAKPFQPAELVETVCSLLEGAA